MKGPLQCDPIPTKEGPLLQGLAQVPPSRRYRPPCAQLIAVTIHLQQTPDHGQLTGHPYSKRGDGGLKVIWPLALPMGWSQNLPP
jgi:hypothetical protein